VDSDDILSNPRAVLSKLCAACGIAFDDAMLKWPKGPKSCDGVWASHWYNAAWESTGFSTPPAKTITLPPELQRIADAARPYYDQLKAHAIKE
jgi:Sulfotransferase domain